MLGTQTAADVSEQLVQPGKGLQKGVMVKGFPVLAAPVLQNLEEGEWFSEDADDTCGLVGAVFLFSAEISLMEHIFHQLVTQGFLGTGAPGDIRSEAQIHLAHPGDGHGQGLKAHRPEEGREFAVPDLIRQRLIHEHHPVNDLTKTKAAFQMDVDMLQKRQTVFRFRQREECAAIQGYGFGGPDGTEDPPVKALPFYGSRSVLNER